MACDQPLTSLQPADLSAFQLSPGTDLDIIAPSVDTSDYSEYDISGPFFPGSDTVGLVIPDFDNFAISPVATQYADLNYDISGCWGPSGAMIFAQAGLYSFLAGVPGAPARVAVAMAPKTETLCQGKPARAAARRPTRYDPLQPTSFPTGETGMVIDDSNDAAILLAQQVLTSKGFSYKKIGGGINTAVTDMNKAIDDTYVKNNRNPISAVEIGHGAPNEWENVTSSFDFAGGNPSNDLLLLEAGSLSKIQSFDIFSCSVAEGNTTAGAPNANHVQTHLARNTVNARGTAVNTRAVNVPIWIIPPRRRGPGSFEIKNTGANGFGTTVLVTCSGTPVTCTSTTTNIFP